MPDILKISGRCGSRIADVNGIVKGNIQDVNNVGGFVAYSPPLDTYTGAAAAYSVRLLRTAYTGDIMRVRRDSDNVEVDVGFDSNDEFGLTSPVSNASSGGPFTDFADFIGHGGTPANGFCRYWYDQSGNAVDAGQSTAVSQPKIYNGTAVITENGKPAVDLDTNKAMRMALVSSSTTATVIAVHNTPSDSDYCALFANGNANGYALTCKDNKYNFFYRSVSDYYPTSTRNIQQSLIFAFTQSATSHKLFADGTSIQDITPDTMLTPTSASSIGKYDNGTFGASRGTIQEIIVYASDQTSNRTGIECNTNGFFQIY